MDVQLSYVPMSFVLMSILLCWLRRLLWIPSLNHLDYSVFMFRCLRNSYVYTSLLVFYSPLFCYGRSISVFLLMNSTCVLEVCSLIAVLITQWMYLILLLFHGSRCWKIHYWRARATSSAHNPPVASLIRQYCLPYKSENKNWILAGAKKYRFYLLEPLAAPSSSRISHKSRIITRAHALFSCVVYP